MTAPSRSLHTDLSLATKAGIPAPARQPALSPPGGKYLSPDVAATRGRGSCSAQGRPAFSVRGRAPDGTTAESTDAPLGPGVEALWRASGRVARQEGGSRSPPGRRETVSPAAVFTRGGN